MSALDIKHCPKCDRMRQHREFSQRANTRDGLQPHCKHCDKVYATAYRAKKAAELAARRANYGQPAQGGA